LCFSLVVLQAPLKTFFEQVLYYAPEDALAFSSYSLIVMILLLPVFGIIADKTGYRKFFFIVCYTVIIVIVPIYMMLANPIHDIGLVFLGLTLLGALSAAICAPAYPYAIKSFEVELRFSGVASSWNMGIALLGGTTPAISTYLTEKFASPIAPAYYLIGVALSLILIKAFVATKKHIEQ
jgi:MFS transporter, MHS family, proline/betaine transporter